MTFESNKKNFITYQIGFLFIKSNKEKLKSGISFDFIHNMIKKNVSIIYYF